MTFTYSDANTPASIAPKAGLLISVQDPQSRILQLRYAQPDVDQPEHITQIITPEGRTIGFAYDASNNLTQVNWPDGKARNFLYVVKAGAYLLSGVVDENNSQLSTFTYDDSRLATGTYRGSHVNEYNVTYTTPPSRLVAETWDAVNQILYRDHTWQMPQGVSVQTPRATSSALSVTNVNGATLLTGQSQPAGSGCAASNSSTAYDANGNIVVQDNFQGERTCYAYDLSRNQESVRIEGLPTSANCASLIVDGATLPSGARKFKTQWHPDWRLKTKVWSPGSINTTVYNGQGDPFNGNALLNCADGATLPDGKALPRACKQVVQATTSIASGEAGAIDTSVSARISSFSYNSAGYVLSATQSGNQVTSFAYYSDTSFTGTAPNAIGHTLGDLQSTTGPSGLITTFDSYDKMGRVLQSTDPKGVVTNVTYTPRGWVQTVTTTAPGQTARLTTYSYDNVGQLTGVANPDGTTLAYSYDAAHRLTGATDTKGNSVTYTLDNSGNRIGEEVKDPTGVLQRSIARSFDALNRVQQVTGRP